jgi:hypothetical protein
MGVLDNDLISGLLLSVLTFVLAMSTLVVYLILRLRRREAYLAEFEPTPEIVPLPRAFAVHRSVSFKRPECWLAIKNRNILSVQAALALHDVKTCSWADGLAGGDQKLFISPPVSNWILVMGPALPNPCDDEDASFRFLQQLSRKLGQIQFFSASGVFDQHAWVRAEMGRISRAYAWSGRTLWNQGEMTAAEKDLGLKCYDYAQTPDSEHEASGNSDKVHLLAARWSLDPDEIDEQFIEQSRGIVGELARYF